MKVALSLVRVHPIFNPLIGFSGFSKIPLDLAKPCIVNEMARKQERLERFRLEDWLWSRQEKRSMRFYD